jgi:hypothetical protein
MVREQNQETSLIFPLSPTLSRRERGRNNGTAINGFRN